MTGNEIIEEIPLSPQANQNQAFFFEDVQTDRNGMKPKYSIRKHAKKEVIHDREINENDVTIPRKRKRDLNSRELEKLDSNIEGIYKCVFCDFDTIRAETMKVHMQIHRSGQEKPFRCDECDFSAFTQKKLDIHIQSHTDERPYKCDQCYFAAPNLARLKRHMKTHEEVKEFKCHVCAYATNYFGNLQNHILIHLDEKPFHCSHCPYSTKDKSNLNRHIKRCKKSCKK